MFKARMSVFCAFAVIGAVIALGSAQQASAYTWEISGGSQANISSSSAGGTSGRIFAMSASAGYLLPSGLELSLTPSITSFGGSIEGQTKIAVLAGLGYSFTPENLQNSFYIEGQAGLTSVSFEGASESDFTFGFSVGKRFDVVEHVTYSPSIGFLDFSSSPTVTTFVISPLAFSFLF